MYSSVHQVYVIENKAILSLTYGTGNIEAIRFICSILYLIWSIRYGPYDIDDSFLLRVVHTQAVLFLKSMSERVGSDIERLLN